MRLLFVLICVGLAIVGIVYLLRRLGFIVIKQGPDAEEVAQTIENFLEGRGGNWDWGDFLTYPIRIPELDAIRKRCAALPDVYPAPKGEYCGEEGVREMRRMIVDLRAPILRPPRTQPPASSNDTGG